MSDSDLTSINFKKCTNCRQFKQKIDFCTDNYRKDKLCNRCRECDRKKVSLRILSEFSKEKKRLNEIGRTSDEKKRIARYKIWKALKSGQIKKWPMCSIAECDESSTVGHHPDYDKPLSVIWLCKKHHGQLHSQFLEQIRKGTILNCST